MDYFFDLADHVFRPSLAGAWSQRNLLGKEKREVKEEEKEKRGERGKLVLFLPFFLSGSPLYQAAEKKKFPSSAGLKTGSIFSILPPSPFVPSILRVFQALSKHGWVPCFVGHFLFSPSRFHRSFSLQLCVKKKSFILCFPNFNMQFM